GPATLTIALPAKWAKEHNLKPGSYVEVNQSETDLIISPDLEKNPENIIIPYDEVLIENMLEKLFLEAESTITIHSEEKIPETINKIVERFPGMQIIEQQPNKIIINRTLKPALTNPDALLRRSYIVIKEALTHNPPQFSSNLNEPFFLLQLHQKRPKEIFILKELYSTLLKLEKPVHDNTYALLRLVFNTVYEQKYNFSSIDTKHLVEIFNRTQDLFKNYYKKSKSPLQISEIHYCIHLLSQLHKETLYKQSIDVLTHAIKQNPKKYRVGVCLKNQSNPFWGIDVKESIKQTVREYKDIELIFKSPLKDFDIVEQEEILKEFTSEGVDGIIFAPIQPKKLKKTIDKINELNIPLVVLDTDVELEENKYTFIGFDNYKGGHLTGKYLKKHLKKGSLIFIIKGHLEGNFTLRVPGFLDAMGKEYKTKVVIGNFQESIAYEKTLEFMKKNKADAIFATSDNMALGAIKAIKEIDKKIPVCGFDMTELGMDALKKGKLLSTVNTKPRELGALAVHTVNNLLTKKTVAERIEYDIELITKDKLDY
ncbi:MAG: substrate-binding domain-containing protein, partial [Nanoarchaeota archaeon]|nr:substrate-binding domain-containing protein [Nanoarchaeota archaeon]MBU1598151.1 substrate-binding domain-containing protein [Nanoarchaeota archaeon]